MKSIDEKEKTTLILQAYWRGRKSRIENKLPINSHPTNCPPSVSGNDPHIALPTQNNNNFVFVGCSGLNNLKIILSMISLDVVDNRNGYKNIPKLYILDSSDLLYQFWIIIKESFRTSNSLALLLARLDSHEPFFKQHCNVNHTRIMPGEYIELLIDFFSRKFSLEKGDVKFEIFYFLKNLLEKASFLRVEWEDKRPFEYIRKHHPAMPIHVYASNIAEYLGYEKKSMEVEAVLSNIALLKPQSIIHTRTDVVHSQCNHMMPEHAVILNEGSVVTNREALTSPNFIPLIKPTLPYAKDNLAKVNRTNVKVLPNMTSQELGDLILGEVTGDNRTSPPIKRRC